VPRPVRIVAVGSAYLAFFLLGAVLAYVWLPLVRLGVRDPAARVAKAQRTVRSWARRYFAWVQFLRLAKVRFPLVPEVVAEGKPAVIVANHPSLLDVIFVSAGFPPLTYVAKASWFHSPFIGPILRACDQIPGPNERTPAAGAATMQGMLDRLAAGRSVLVFPEGTRSPRRGLLPFQRGAFEAAVRAGVPLIPCVVWVDPPMLRKDQHWYEVASRAVEFQMRVLPTLRPAAGESAKALARRLRQVYLRELGLPPDEPAAAASSGRAGAPAPEPGAGG
jgi:1-acyl-sn-glycerol-3-phosphate acyltransferase